MAAAPAVLPPSPALFVETGASYLPWPQEWENELTTGGYAEHVTAAEITSNEDIIAAWQLVRRLLLAEPNVKALINFLGSKNPTTHEWQAPLDTIRKRGISKGNKMFNTLHDIASKVHHRLVRQRHSLNHSNAYSSNSGPNGSTVHQNNNDVPLFSLKNYYIMEKLSTGAVGQVHFAVDKTTGKYLACKVLNKSQARGDPYLFKRLKEELQITKEVSGQRNVLGCHEVYSCQDKIFVFMEFCDADLITFVRASTMLDEPSAHRFFVKIATGLLSMHQLGICHRDVKLENILLQRKQPKNETEAARRGLGGVIGSGLVSGRRPNAEEFDVRIGDFGAAVKNDPDLPVLVDTVGTLSYCAPEVIRAQNTRGYSGRPADVWSLGIVLYAMVCGTLPVNLENMSLTGAYNALMTAFSERTVVQADAGSSNEPPVRWTGVRFNSRDECRLSPELKDLIRRMLEFEPRTRPTLENVLSHPWVVKSGPRNVRPAYLVSRHRTFRVPMNATCAIGDTTRHDTEPFRKSLVPTSSGQLGPSSLAGAAAPIARRHKQKVARLFAARGPFAMCVQDTLGPDCLPAALVPYGPPVPTRERSGPHASEVPREQQANLQSLLRDSLCLRYGASPFTTRAPPSSGSPSPPALQPREKLSDAELCASRSPPDQRKSAQPKEPGQARSLSSTEASSATESRESSSTTNSPHIHGAPASAAAGSTGSYNDSHSPGAWTPAGPSAAQAANQAAEGQQSPPSEPIPAESEPRLPTSYAIGRGCFEFGGRPAGDTFLTLESGDAAVTTTTSSDKAPSSSPDSSRRSTGRPPAQIFSLCQDDSPSSAALPHARLQAPGYPIHLVPQGESATPGFHGPSRGQFAFTGCRPEVQLPACEGLVPASMMMAAPYSHDAYAWRQQSRQVSGNGPSTGSSEVSPKPAAAVVGNNSSSRDIPAHGRRDFLHTGAAFLHQQNTGAQNAASYLQQNMAIPFQAGDIPADSRFEPAVGGPSGVAGLSRNGFQPLSQNSAQRQARRADGAPDSSYGRSPMVPLTGMLPPPFMASQFPGSFIACGYPHWGMAFVPPNASGSNAKANQA